MNLQSKFGNCITTQTLIIALFIEAGWNYGQMGGQTIWLLDAPGGPFRPGGIKSFTMQCFYTWKIVAAFQGMHVSPAKHSYASVTDGRTNRQTDRQTDDGQSDPYLSPAIAMLRRRHNKNCFKCIPVDFGICKTKKLCSRWYVPSPLSASWESFFLFVCRTICSGRLKLSG